MTASIPMHPLLRAMASDLAARLRDDHDRSLAENGPQRLALRDEDDAPPEWDDEDAR